MNSSKRFDNVLIKAIKKNSNKNYSFIEEVANALDIGYDAAYRRIKGKTSITLADAIKLSKYFKISLGNLFDQKEEDTFVISKTKEISDIIELEQYFLNLTRNLQHLNNKDSSILYNAKDLPIFYVLSDNLLSRFKIFAWLYILDNNFKLKHTPFHQFKIPKSLLNASINAGLAYNNVAITEVWNYGVLNSIINQITYFFEIKLLNYRDATIICKDLKHTIENIEKTSQLGVRNNKPYKLYHNELLILNNNVLIKYRNKKNLISPYSLLRYYLIEDQATCDKFEVFMNNQLSFSKLLSQTGIKYNTLFFNPLYKQIDKLKQRIELLRQFPIS